MTTTDKFQHLPEFYTSKDECDSHAYRVVNTNTKYPFYKQTHFTAGDERQFMQYSLSTTLSTTVKQTFRYIFHKFKKGMLVRVSNEKMAVFLPFSKYKFINEWNHLIQLDSEYSSWNDFFRYICEMEGREFKPHKVNRYSKYWYANNALIRYEFPIRENDSGVAPLSHMFKVLCQTYKIPNVDFFVNKRDYPLLRKDRTESYNWIWGDQHPMVTHRYDEYAPIFSMCSTDDHSDIPIPTWYDWARICAQESIYFPKTPVYEDRPDINWSDKNSVAVFRGSSTGFGLDKNTNMRLKVANLSMSHSNLLDAGITKWNARPRKIKNTPFLGTIVKGDLETVDFKSYQDQCRYKYIVNIDGHTKAFRLSSELGSGSVVLMVESPYRLWYSHLLVPWVHYVPIKSDCSDLIDKIEWCKENDDVCQRIVNNSLAFYEEHLSKDGILRYLKELLESLAN